eukprot:TRINITY_DN9402_c0_g1_i1.p1 TRINITY_DN9402_c0_g1~~TRINITY_DN9402_c0_g1_i1.p1  ORF type:complete len:1368 (+),score=248.60 TRINITY_DN9402_c0_g1_i1:54-4157(+)
MATKDSDFKLGEELSVSACGASGVPVLPYSAASLMQQAPQLPSSPILSSPRTVVGAATANALQRVGLGAASSASTTGPCHSGPASPRGPLPAGDLPLLASNSSGKGSGGSRTGSICDLGPGGRPQGLHTSDRGSEGTPDERSHTEEEDEDERDVRDEEEDEKDTELEMEAKTASLQQEQLEREEDLAKRAQERTVARAPHAMERRTSSREDERRRQARNLGKAFAFAAQTLQHHLLICLKLLGLMFERHTKRKRVPEESSPAPSKALSMPSPCLPVSTDGASFDPPGLPWQPLDGSSEGRRDEADERFLLSTAMISAALKSAISAVAKNQDRCLVDFPETGSQLQDEFISFDGTLTTVYEDEDALTKKDRTELPQEVEFLHDDLNVLKREFRHLRGSMPALQRRRVNVNARLEELEELKRTLQDKVDAAHEDDGENQSGNQEVVQEDARRPELWQLEGLMLETRRDEHGAEVSQAALAQLLSHMRSLKQKVKERRLVNPSSQARLNEADAAFEAWQQERMELLQTISVAGGAASKDMNTDIVSAVRSLQQRQAERAARPKPLVRRPVSRDPGSASNAAAGACGPSAARWSSTGGGTASSSSSSQRVQVMTTEAESHTHGGRACHSASASRGRRTGANVKQAVPAPTGDTLAEGAEAKLRELSARYAEVQRQYQRVVSENCRLREELDGRGLMGGSEALFSSATSIAGGSSLTQGPERTPSSVTSADLLDRPDIEVAPDEYHQPDVQLAVDDFEGRAPHWASLGMNGEARRSPGCRDLSTHLSPEAADDAALRQRSMSPWPGIPTWPAAAIMISGQPCTGRPPASPGPMRRAAGTANTQGAQSTPPVRARTAPRRPCVDEGLRNSSPATGLATHGKGTHFSRGNSTGSRMQHSHASPQEASEVASHSAPASRQQQQQRFRVKSNVPGGGPAQELRQNSRSNPRLAKAAGDGQVPDAALDIRCSSAQDSGDQQPAPEPLPEYGVHSPPLPAGKASGSGNNSARSPRSGTSSAAAPASTSGGCDMVAQQSFAAAASAALSSSLCTRPVSVPKSWEDEQSQSGALHYNALNPRSLINAQMVPGNLHAGNYSPGSSLAVVAGMGHQSSGGCSWGPGPPSRQSSPDSRDPDTLSVSPVRRTLQAVTAAAAAASGAVGRLQQVSQAGVPWTPGPMPQGSAASPPRPSVQSSPTRLSGTAIAQHSPGRAPGASSARRVPPRPQVSSPCYTGQQASAPAPASTLVRGKAQTSSTRSLGAPPQRSPSPVPQLVRSASAHSMTSHSPERRSCSPGPALSPCRPASPVLLTQPQLPQDIAQAALAAAAAAQGGRGSSRTTWPTPAVHAQLARAGAMGGLPVSAPSQVIARSGVVTHVDY